MQVTGPDLSAWDDDNNTPRKVDFARMRARGAKFVFIKVGQGGGTDPDFIDFWAGARAEAIPRGGFWFYDDRNPPINQGDRFADALWGDVGELPVVFDLERDYGGSYPGWKNWRLAIETFRSRIPNKEVIIYTGYYFWKDHIANNEEALTYFRQFRLWIATYNPAPMIPLPWTTYLFWQYTDKEDGIAYGSEAHEIDMNVYNGDAVSFAREFNLPPPLPEVPTHPFPGADHLKRRAYGSDVHVFTIHNGDAHVHWVGGRSTVLAVAKATGAPLAVNGGDYNPYTGDPTGLLAVDGRVVSLKEGYMPWLNITKDRLVHINEWNSTEPAYNALALRRMLVRDGKICTDTSAAWYERHPKTAYGVNAAGKLLIIEADGRTAQSAGVTLFELAQLMLDAGAVRAGDAGGGGDCTVIVNGQVANVPIADKVPGELRPVADSVVVFSLEAIALNERRKLIGYNKGSQGDLNQTGICRAFNDCSGAQWLVTLSDADLALLWKVNGITSADDPKWRWALGVGFFGKAYYKATTTSPVQWPYIVVCSAIDGSKINTVHVTGYDRGFYKLDLIPASFDPNINPSDNPDWFHRCIAQSCDTPQGIFWMPLFSPVGRRHSVGEEGTWLQEFYVDGKVSEEPPMTTVPFVTVVSGVPNLLGPKPLNIRESASLHNLGKVGFYNVSAEVQVLELRDTKDFPGEPNDGIFGRVDWKHWICLYNRLKNQWYVKWRPIP